jgi:N-acetylmuramoyl-L-alanine amidase
LVVNSLRTSAGLAREPARSAAFKVLQQPSAPSVLIELGYMSNEQDAALLTSPDWQGKVAASIGQAVDSYFRQRTAGRAGP